MLWVLCVCAHFRGLTSQRAAQCNGRLISILVFPIKPHYMKLLLNALTQNTQIQLSYLRICIFHISFVPIDLLTVSVCTAFCTYSTSILVGICTYSYCVRVCVLCTYGVRVPYIHVQWQYICTYCICKLNLILQCTHFRFKINWGGGLIWKFYCNL